jgi:hypothetical protein
MGIVLVIAAVIKAIAGGIRFQVPAISEGIKPELEENR